MTDIKSYISKLNDRNLQRKRESGITTYVFYSITILILYQIINIYPNINFKPYFWHNIVFIAYTLNLLSGARFIFSSYYEYTSSYSSPRIISNHHKKMLFDQAFDFCGMTLTLLINSLAWISTSNDSIYGNHTYFMIITLFYGLLTLSTLISSFRNRTINYTYKILEGSNKNLTDKNPVSIILYITGLLLLVSSSYYIFTTDFPNKQRILLFSIYLYCFHFVLEKLIQLHKQDSFTEALEQLEYEINIKDLKDDDIRQRLQNNYLGYHLADWIIYNTNLLDSMILETDKKTSELETALIELNLMNKKNFEFQGKSVEKSKLLEEINKDLINFVAQKLRDIEGFWKISRINIVDRNDLSDFYSKLKKLQSNNQKV